MALLADLLEARIVVEDMFVEVAGKYDEVAAGLKALDECDEVMAKVVTWICVFPFFAFESCRLLVVGSNSLKVGRFLANLVYSNVRNGAVVLSLEMRI